METINDCTIEIGMTKSGSPETVLRNQVVNFECNDSGNGEKFGLMSAAKYCGRTTRYASETRDEIEIIFPGDYFYNTFGDFKNYPDIITVYNLEV